MNNSDNSKNCHKIYPYNPIIDNLVKIADNQSRPSRVSERHVYTGRTNVHHKTSRLNMDI